MANWFQKMLIGTALVGSLSTNQAQAAENISDDKNVDKTEIKATNKQQAQSPKIYLKTIEVNNYDPVPGMLGFDLNSNMAYYDIHENRIVCMNYHISDEVAYNKVDVRVRDKDFPTALNKFCQALEQEKYKGKMPENLSDIKKIIANKDHQLSDKKISKIRYRADLLGFTSAIKIKDIVDDVNKSNTSPTVIRHEIQHMQQDLKEEAAGTTYNSFLPSSLLAPQDQLLLILSQEIEAWCKSGESGCSTLSEAMKKYREERASKYMNTLSDQIRHNPGFTRETYKYSYAQNLDMEYKLEGTKFSPIKFGETQSVTIGNKKYDIAKCINHEDGSWCYSVPPGNDREQVPDGTVITGDNGQKYECNVLYDKNNKPMLDNNGNTMHAYCTYGDGWKMHIYESTPHPVDNNDFSRKNLDERLSVLYGEKSSSNEFRNLLEKELDFYRQSKQYQTLKFMTSNIMNDAAYVAECRENPLTDDFVKKGIDFINSRYVDKETNLKDITDKVACQEKLSQHMDYLREGMAERNGNSKETENIKLGEQKGTTFDMTTLIQTNAGQER